MKNLLRGALGLVVACALAWLVFRGTDWREVGDAIRHVDLAWLAVGQAVLWASYFARAHRFGFVVRAASPASFRALLSSTQIGFLVNFTVPARIGELVRAVLLARMVRLPLPRALAMVALDRVGDVIGLLAVVLVAAVALAADAHVELPPGTLGNSSPLAISGAWVRGTATLLGAGVVAILAVLVLLYASRERVLGLAHRALRWLPDWLAQRILAVLDGFAEGLAVFRSAGDLSRVLLWSLVTWGANVVTLAAILEAFGVAYPWYTPFLMLAMVAVLIAVPVTPGVVGQFHLPAVAALLMAAPATGPGVAKAVAIVTHLSTLLPIAGLGIWCLLRERVGLLSVVRESQVAEASEGAAAATP
jgi:uncharacterized membrane protein YbhN (UPF0104 family)